MAMSPVLQSFLRTDIWRQDSWNCSFSSPEQEGIDFKNNTFMAPYITGLMRSERYSTQEGKMCNLQWKQNDCHPFTMSIMCYWSRQAIVTLQWKTIRQSSVCAYMKMPDCFITMLLFCKVHEGASFVSQNLCTIDFTNPARKDMCR